MKSANIFELLDADLKSIVAEVASLGDKVTLTIPILNERVFTTDKRFLYNKLVGA